MSSGGATSEKCTGISFDDFAVPKIEHHKEDLEVFRVKRRDLGGCGGKGCDFQSQLRECLIMGTLGLCPAPPPPVMFVGFHTPFNH